VTPYPCPQGCGGWLTDTSVNAVCPSCRRGVWQTMATHELTGETRDPEYCWEWWGPTTHRMKCRRSKGHAGEHFDHPDNEDGSHTIVAVGGAVVR
jgi:hypothetical protein